VPWQVRLCIKVERARAVMGGPYDEWHSTVLRLLRRLLFPAWDSAKRRYPPDLWNRDVFDEFVDTMEAAIPFHVLHSWVSLDLDVAASGVAPAVGLELSLLSGHCRPYASAELHAPWLRSEPALISQAWWQAMLRTSCSGRCCLPVEHAADGLSSGVSHVKIKYDFLERRVVDVKVYLAASMTQSPARGERRAVYSDTDNSNSTKAEWERHVNQHGELRIRR